MWVFRSDIFSGRYVDICNYPISGEARGVRPLMQRPDREGWVGVRGSLPARPDPSLRTWCHSIHFVVIKSLLKESYFSSFWRTRQDISEGEIISNLIYHPRISLNSPCFFIYPSNRPCCPPAHQISHLSRFSLKVLLSKSSLTSVSHSRCRYSKVPILELQVTLYSTALRNSTMLRHESIGLSSSIDAAVPKTSTACLSPFYSRSRGYSVCSACVRERANGPVRGWVTMNVVQLTIGPGFPGIPCVPRCP